ncbi:MAG: hypothetical protein ABJB86_20735 [Bacteroidota bacterium]
MDAQNKRGQNVSFRKAGWAAIASAAIGILSFVALITGVSTRNSLIISRQGISLFRVHDAGVILQLLLFLPAVFALYDLLKQKSPGVSKSIRNTGVAAITCTVLFLLMIFPNILADILYMFPQGIFGFWLIIINCKLKGMLPAGLRWFGVIVGTGLVMVGIFPPAYAIFVDAILIYIPAAPPGVIENIPVNTPANIFLHQTLWIGSLMGVLTLPAWTILLGVNLLRKAQTDL